MMRAQPIAGASFVRSIGWLGGIPINWHNWFAALFFMLVLDACAQGDQAQVPYTPFSPEDMHDRGCDRAGEAAAVGQVAGRGKQTSPDHSIEARSGIPLIVGKPLDPLGRDSRSPGSRGGRSLLSGDSAVKRCSQLVGRELQASVALTISATCSGATS